MPRAGMMWRHVIISTRRSWLHGDPRGFRSRKHCIHSSGDYKNPPPNGEHAGLLRYEKGRAKGTSVKIPKHLRAQLGGAIVRAILSAGYRLLVVSVSAKHLHLLVELPINPAASKRIVGRWKTVRTRAVRAELRGSIWGEGGKYKPVKTRAHERRVFGYVRDDQGPGAWCWTFRDPLPEETTSKVPRTSNQATPAPSG